MNNESPKRAPATVWPKIPTRYHYSGDKAKAATLKGLGWKRYNALQTSLGFQDLPTGFNTLKLADGTTIRASQSFGLSTVEIFVPYVKKEGKEERIEPCRCCFDCVAVGILVSNCKVVATRVGADVEVCQKVEGGIVYTFYENLPIAGWPRPLVEGDTILVVTCPVIRPTPDRYSSEDGGAYPYVHIYYKLYQIFNCISFGSIRQLIEDGVDLTSQGIDSDAYIVTKSSCTSLNDDIFIEDPADYEENPEECPTRTIIAYGVPFEVSCLTRASEISAVETSLNV